MSFGISWYGSCPGQVWTAACWFDLAAAPAAWLVALPVGLVWRYEATIKSLTIQFDMIIEHNYRKEDMEGKTQKLVMKKQKLYSFISFFGK